MKTIREENEIDLVKMISNKIGFTISIREAAIELLNKYDESSTKKLKSIKYDEKTGILNSTLIFLK